MMETSLSRFGMILDSIQSDIMQVNKGRKELALESKYFCGWIKTSNSIRTITIHKSRTRSRIGFRALEYSASFNHFKI